MLLPVADLRIWNTLPEFVITAATPSSNFFRHRWNCFCSSFLFRCQLLSGPSSDLNYLRHYNNLIDWLMDWFTFTVCEGMKLNVPRYGLAGAHRRYYVHGRRWAKVRSRDWHRGRPATERPVRGGCKWRRRYDELRRDVLGRRRGDRRKTSS